ncbi:MAG: DNA polymerase III subunit beta [Pirellulaceae bacterium]|nr:MAG: DNA polymerase III subunit beta [Pirellulaceae bacterium]
MEVVFDRQQLSEALGAASAIASLVGRENKLLQNFVKLFVRPDRSYLWATSVIHSIRIAVPTVEVVRPGVALLPIGEVGAIVRENPDERLKLEVSGSILHISGQNTYQFPFPDPDEYPNPPGLEKGAGVGDDSGGDLEGLAAAEVPAVPETTHETNARLLSELIRRTCYAADVESSRYALGGVFFEFHPNRLVAVATDARRLAKMEVPCEAVAADAEQVKTALVPSKALEVLQRVLATYDGPIRIGTGERNVAFTSDKFEVALMQLEGRFPKWREVLERLQPGQALELVAGSFLAAVRQAAIVCTAESKGLSFNLSEGELRIQATSEAGATSHVRMPVSYSGPNVEVTLDAKFVTDFLRLLDPMAVVTFEVVSRDSPTVFRTSDEYLYLVMPMSRR